MAARIGTLGIFTILFFLLEGYTYFGLRSIFKTAQSIRIFNIAYLLQTLFVGYCFYQMYTGLTSGEVFRSTKVNFSIGLVFTVFVTKLVFCSLMLLQDGSRF